MHAGHLLGDRYELGERIAEGASSTVWEARDTRGGGLVAIKAVSLERAGWRAEVRDRFMREARLLELSQHPHLVRVRDLGETDDGVLYLVLDRLEGETLADRLARPPALGFREAARIAVELAGGLGALHARGIVHRDLKPANVILHREGDGAKVAKIIDLGISKAAASAADPAMIAALTETGQVLGTPEYMSVEQALGSRDVDARADVWALGVVLYEMLAGRRPFEGENPNAVLAAIRRGEPAPLRGVPAPLAEVVTRCLQRAREDRPRDGAALAEVLAEAVARASEDEVRRGRRRSLLLVGGVALGAAVIAIATLSARARSEAPHAPSTTSPSAPLVIAVTASSVAPPAPSNVAPRAPDVPPSARAPRPATRVNTPGF